MRLHKNVKLDLQPVKEEDWDAFIKFNQECYNEATLEKFGECHVRFDEEGQVISRQEILNFLETQFCQAFWIMQQRQRIGGLIVSILGTEAHLEIMFITPRLQSKGRGKIAWRAVEAAFPDIKQWNATTPYDDQRNINFFVNHCGFKIVRYQNEYFTYCCGYQMENDNFLVRYPQGLFDLEKQISK